MSEHETGGPPGSRGNVCDMIRGLPEVAEKACGGGGINVQLFCKLGLDQRSSIL